MNPTPLDASSVRWLTLGVAFVSTVFAATSMPHAMLAVQGTPETVLSPVYRTVMPYAWGVNVAPAATFWAMFIVRSLRPAPTPPPEDGRSD